MLAKATEGITGLKVNRLGKIASASLRAIVSKSTGADYLYQLIAGSLHRRSIQDSLWFAHKGLS